MTTQVAPITDEEVADFQRRYPSDAYGVSPSFVRRFVARIRAEEARADRAERERDALVAKVHEVYEQGHSGPLWKVREWMIAHVTGAKNEGKGG